VDAEAGDGHAAHPQIAVAGSRAFVVWDEATKPGLRVWMREVAGPAGSRAANAPVLLSDEASSTYPSIAARPTALVAAWTRRSPAGSEIAVRRVTLD
jgi:hypothetical protein